MVRPARPSFGVRELGPAFSTADSSAVGDAPRRVAASKSGAESPHSKISFRAAVVRNSGARHRRTRWRCPDAGFGDGEGKHEACPFGTRGAESALGARRGVAERFCKRASGALSTGVQRMQSTAGRTCEKCQATDEHGFAQMKREDLSVLIGVNPWLRSIFSHLRSGCAPVSHAPSLCPRHFPASFIGGFRLEDESNCRRPKRLYPLECLGETEWRQYAALWRGKRRYVRGTPWRARTICRAPLGAPRAPVCRASPVGT
jgi:hypothetical protein